MKTDVQMNLECTFAQTLFASQQPRQENATSFISRHHNLPKGWLKSQFKILLLGYCYCNRTIGINLRYQENITLRCTKSLL